jgi:hypothetical protein
MRKIILLLLLNTSALAQTHVDLNKSAQNNYYTQKHLLDNMCNVISKKYADDSNFVYNFKNAQFIWEKSCEADLNLRFPKNLIYGSSINMCYYEINTENIIERIKFIKQWIDGETEGDLCNGTIHLK